jgi:hypothetical protein
VKNYQDGVRDAVRFCLTHVEHGGVHGPGAKYKDDDAYFIAVRPDRVNPGELLPGSAAHRERSIEIWSDAALASLTTKHLP